MIQSAEKRLGVGVNPAKLLTLREKEATFSSNDRPKGRQDPRKMTDRELCGEIKHLEFRSSGMQRRLKELEAERKRRYRENR